MYFCDPRWHSGSKTAVARFFVRSVAQSGVRSAMDPGFACCGAHLGRAVAHMMATYGWRSVEVRDVSGRAEHAAGQAAAAAEG